MQLQSDADNMCGSLCKLTRKQRLYGFAICFGFGFALSIVVRVCARTHTPPSQHHHHTHRPTRHPAPAFQGAIFVASGKLVPFAVCYSLGTICSLAR